MREMGDSVKGSASDATIGASRRRLLTGGVAAGLAATGAAISVPTAAYSATVDDIPELAPQWKKLDRAEILKLPAAYVSISQSKSLYVARWRTIEREAPRARQSRGHNQSCRRRSQGEEFYLFQLGRLFDLSPALSAERLRQGAVRKLGVEGLNWSPEKIAWDDEIVEENQAKFQPGDNHLFEKALQTAFVGTDLPLEELARKRVQVIVLTGIHLDWCIEGNARAARDHGYLPIVIGDATATQKPEQAKAAFERINNFFAPVISADTFVKSLSQNA